MTGWRWNRNIKQFSVVSRYCSGRGYINRVFGLLMLRMLVPGVALHPETGRGEGPRGEFSPQPEYPRGEGVCLTFKHPTRGCTWGEKRVSKESPPPDVGTTSVRVSRDVPPFYPLFHLRYTLVGSSNVKHTPVTYHFLILSHSLWVIFVKFSNLTTLFGSFFWKFDTPVGVKIHTADPSPLSVSGRSRQGWGVPPPQNPNVIRLFKYFLYQQL